MDEYLKKINDLAVAAGENLISLQTEYIHLKYHSLQEEKDQTIPILENFLFALALFKSRSVENVTRAKTLIEKLLYFQTSDGQFPIYLHEYPECKDHYLAILLLAPLYRIYHGFHQILGSSLKARLEKALVDLLTYSLKISEEKNPPYIMRIRLGASLFAIGYLFALDHFTNEGKRRLFEFNEISKEWFLPRTLGDLMISSEMAGKEFSQKFLDHLANIWHLNLSCYAGPEILEYQSAFEPEVTLYDLFMGYLTKKFSKRALKADPVHLQGALIVSSDFSFVDGPLPSQLESKINEQPFFCFKAKDYCFSFTEPNTHKVQDKGFSPYRFSWGSPDRLHTLTVEGANSQKISFTKHQNRHEFLFFLEQLPELEDKEKCREVVFYFDLFDKAEISIEGIKATTFQIGEKVELSLDGFKFDLTFEIASGNGQFLGHIMRGNRPSQISNKGKNRFSAFDNQIFIRTIRREEAVVIKAILSLQGY